MGVMVPCDKILDAAIEHKADIIGTPRAAHSPLTVPPALQACRA